LNQKTIVSGKLIFFLISALIKPCNATYNALYCRNAVIMYYNTHLFIENTFKK